MSESNLNIDFDVNQEDIQIVLDVTEFFEVNKEIILSDIKPIVVEFLRNEATFQGPFALAFDEEYKKFISKEIKDKVIDNFNIDPEKAMYLVEMLDLMGILNYYLDKDKYLEQKD